MKMRTKASVLINAPQEAIWDYVTTPDNFPNYFWGWGPIPGVEKIEVTSNHRSIAGGLEQRVATTDGRIAEERVLSVRKPEFFEYEVLSGFDFPFGLFVRKGALPGPFCRRAQGTGLPGATTLNSLRR
ncbi:MAG: hypothetical protein FJ316_11155 [SAR202 cluster bacterium]|nr:hypothetical protein [SAR202 cluster bacterium]